KLFWSPKSEIAVFLGGSVARLGDPSRWKAIATALLAEIDPQTGWPRWGAVWPFAISSCLWVGASGARHGHIVRAALGLSVGGGLAADVFIYLSSPGNLSWWLHTSLDRLLLQLLPLALICGFDWPGPRASALRFVRGEPG